MLQGVREAPQASRLLGEPSCPGTPRPRPCRRDLNQNVAGLLDELDIPRAISAPPHLDDRWAAQLVRRRRSHALRPPPRGGTWTAARALQQCWAAAGSGRRRVPGRQALPCTPPPPPHAHRLRPCRPPARRASSTAEAAMPASWVLRWATSGLMRTMTASTARRWVLAPPSPPAAAACMRRRYHAALAGCVAPRPGSLSQAACMHALTAPLPGRPRAAGGVWQEAAAAAGQPDPV